MCQGMKRKKENARRLYQGKVEERDFIEDKKNTFTESQTAIDEFVSALEEYLSFIGDYSSSLDYVGQCLKYVIINDEPFDRDKCIKLAHSMDNVKTQFETIKDDFKAKSEELTDQIEDLISKIKKLDKEIPKLKKAMDEINENASCGECEECIAAQNAAYKAIPRVTQTGGGGCFLAGTKVYTREGMVNIEDVKENDYVLSYDFKEKRNVFNRVNKLLIHEYNDEDIYELTIRNKILKVTENHRFFISNEMLYGWIPAKKLKVNDRVMILNNTLQKIEKIEKYAHKGTVYNLEVDNVHNYFVSEDGILVHNNKDNLMVVK